jgi:hypothetical protein
MFLLVDLLRPANLDISELVGCRSVACIMPLRLFNMCVIIIIIIDDFGACGSALEYNG